MIYGSRNNYVIVRNPNDKKVFSMDDIANMAELVAMGGWPNGTVGDDECNLWSYLRSFADAMRNNDVSVTD